MTTRLTRARRVIVKIGSVLLVEEASGELRREWLATLADRSEEHTSELQSHSFISDAVCCLKKKKKQK